MGVLGQNRERGGAIVTQRACFYFWRFLRLCQFLVKIDQECDRESAHRRTDTQHWQTQTGFIICSMLSAIAMGQIINMMMTMTTTTTTMMMMMMMIPVCMFSHLLSNKLQFAIHFHNFSVSTCNFLFQLTHLSLVLRLHVRAGTKQWSQCTCKFFTRRNDRISSPISEMLLIWLIDAIISTFLLYFLSFCLSSFSFQIKVTPLCYWNCFSSLHYHYAFCSQLNRWTLDKV